MTNQGLDQQFENFKIRPHLVILGAGATMATIPYGDKNGKKSSVMNNFIEELGLGYIFNDIKLKTTSKNIEEIYSELYEREEYSLEREKLEDAIAAYFKTLELPDSPTIYDLLILSLRDKDCIASFNWDNLLIQAYQRVSKITRNLPNLLFLHGNVSAGYCPECGKYGALNRKCNCGKQFMPSPLLYPIKEKDYTSDRFIKTQWEQFEKKIEEAGYLTIFGYSAPQTDVEAMRIMEKAFSTESKFFHGIEVIDIDKESLIRDNWRYFDERTNWHINVIRSFSESILAKFPRRSIEAYKRNISGWWGESSIQFNVNFDDLSKTVTPLLENENDNNFEVI